MLETGNGKAGLEHIIDRHIDDLAAKGIAKEEIPSFIKNKILTQKPIEVTSKNSGLEAKYIVDGQKYKLAYGTNGYIVSFYPVKN